MHYDKSLIWNPLFSLNLGLNCIIMLPVHDANQLGLKYWPLTLFTILLLLLLKYVWLYSQQHGRVFFFSASQPFCLHLVPAIGREIEEFPCRSCEVCIFAYPFQMLARLAGAEGRHSADWMELSFPAGVMPHAESPTCCLALVQTHKGRWQRR